MSLMYRRTAVGVMGSDKIAELVAGRNDAYGGAWLKTGKVLGFMTETLRVDLTPIIQSGYFLNWFTILCKLIRALATPYNKDHWDDIAGYARLISEHLETGSDRLAALNMGDLTVDELAKIAGVEEPDAVRADVLAEHQAMYDERSDARAAKKSAEAATMTDDERAQFDVRR